MGDMMTAWRRLMWLRGETHGFPRVRTSLVGRDEEITEVASLLARHQLVTVTGPGGVGKTRVAFEVARRAAAGFADGAWLVELAAITDPAQVPGAVAVALGIQPDAGQPLAEVGREFGALRQRQLLLALDNCEHVLTAVTGFCERLLATADDVRVLATSREPIGLPDEVVDPAAALGGSVADRGHRAKRLRGGGAVH